VLKPGRGNLFPGGTVRGECRRKFVILGGCGEISDRGQGSPVQGVREGLVLDWFRLHGGRSGEVGSLEVGSREVRHSRANGGGEISDRFLDLGRIVVGFELINPCDPIERGVGQGIREF